MLRFLWSVIVLAALFFGASFIFRTVYSLPSAEGWDNSTAIEASSNTELGSLILELKSKHAGKSGVSPLIHGPDAFAARIVLAEAAQTSIDVRYYIWQKDLTGLLLLQSLHDAADRGVQVRMLLDDNGIPDLDPELAEMDAHPNIEVRIFNPFVLRSPRIVSYLLDFRRLNRRMHNKSMTFDGVAAIVGGRNIGDIYFYRNEEVNYFDFDVTVIGDAAREVDEDFDIYWASEISVPIADLVAPDDPQTDTLAAAVSLARAAPGGQEYLESIQNSRILEELTDDARGFEWVEMALVSDDPAKAQGKMDESGYLSYRLLQILTPPKQEVDLISAYFVPGPVIRDALTRWAQAGIEVRTLTNAQEATDVLPVHGAYRKYRDELLRGGVRLFELRSSQELPRLRDQFGLIGSKNSSLHAKTFVIDRSEIFVGSYNFDPRSAFLNTEMGFLIDSPALARLVTNTLDESLDSWAYEVVRTDDGNLSWLDRKQDGQPARLDKEPNTSVLSRSIAALFGILPIEWML